MPNMKKKMDTHATDFNQKGAFFLSSRGRLNINGSVSPASNDNMTGLFCSHNRNIEKASAIPFSFCIRCGFIFVFPIHKVNLWGTTMGYSNGGYNVPHSCTPLLYPNKSQKRCDRLRRSCPLSVLSGASR